MAGAVKYKSDLTTITIINDSPRVTGTTLSVKLRLRVSDCEHDGAICCKYDDVVQSGESSDYHTTPGPSRHREMQSPHICQLVSGPPWLSYLLRVIQ